MSAPEWKFDLKQFRFEVSQLREAWGLKPFWEKEGRSQAALGAVFFVYLNTPPTDEAATLWESTQNEFERRQRFAEIGI
jgi:hypothetical protein